MDTSRTWAFIIKNLFENEIDWDIAPVISGITTMPPTSDFEVELSGGTRFRVTVKELDQHRNQGVQYGNGNTQTNIF